MRRITRCGVSLAANKAGKLETFPVVSDLMGGFRCLMPLGFEYLHVALSLCVPHSRDDSAAVRSHHEHSQCRFSRARSQE